MKREHKSELKRVDLGRILKISISLILIVSAVRGLVSRQIVINKSKFQSAAIEKDIEAALSTQEDLKNKLEGMKNEENVKEVARERFNLVDNNERIYRDSNSSK